MRTVVMILFAILCLASIPVKAQSPVWDTVLIRGQDFDNHAYDRRAPVFLFSNRKNVLVKYNPVTLTFGGLLYFYQKAISPQISANCPYEISCSNFSKQCIHHYGLLKGIALTADRLTRCTQFTLIDLVPVQLSKEKRIIDPVEQYTFRHAH